MKTSRIADIAPDSAEHGISSDRKPWRLVCTKSLRHERNERAQSFRPVPTACRASSVLAEDQLELLVEIAHDEVGTLARQNAGENPPSEAWWCFFLWSHESSMPG